MGRRGGLGVGAAGRDDGAAAVARPPRLLLPPSRAAAAARCGLAGRERGSAARRACLPLPQQAHGLDVHQQRRDQTAGSYWLTASHTRHQRHGKHYWRVQRQEDSGALLHTHTPSTNTTTPNTPRQTHDRRTSRPPRRRSAPWRASRGTTWCAPHGGARMHGSGAHGEKERSGRARQEREKRERRRESWGKVG